MAKWQRSLYLPCLPLGEDGRKATGSPKHLNLSKEAAKEGMVLLKNEDNLLPLTKGTRVALFGKATIDYVKSGGGSGDVIVDHVTDLAHGMLAVDELKPYMPLVEEYEAYVAKERAAGGEPGLIAEMRLPEETYRDARAFAEVAIISLSRFSGEAWDRRGERQEGPNEGDPNCGAGCLEKSIQIFERGDFYLSKREEELIAGVKAHFDKVIVILNVGGIVTTSWIRDDAQIGAAMIIWNAGEEGGLATAEVLSGKGYPSGKLTDTFADCLEDYPSTAGFHESDDYVNYEDDIFVGYRYFATIPGAMDKVVYPFGYGLTYTTYACNVDTVTQSKERIEIEVTVFNTGKLPGKQVIQAYVEAPQGKLGKAKRVLVAFAKTPELAPSESAKLKLTIPVERMASYDDLGLIQKSAYVLEPGDYEIYVGDSLVNVEKLPNPYKVESARILEQCTPKCVPTSLARRMKPDGSYEELPLLPPNDPNASEIEWALTGIGGGCLSAPVRARAPRDIFNHPYSEDRIQLIDVAEGRHSAEELLAQMTDDELIDLLGGQPNNGVGTTYGIGNQKEFGIPNAITADGPAGLRVEPQMGVTTTAWPCATSLACSFNPELVETVGAAGALEVKENNVAMWLTPAVNIHRSPLCGRNFEYYSEDPFVAGKIGAAMVRGIQSQGISVSVKHFACNNKETNRYNSDSHVSERALREIYLKQFEIIVKESDPWCIMTAYNMLNGWRTSENRELLQGILREEWGYNGMITTDWWNCGNHYKEVKAGNDVKMACGFPQNLKAALAAGVLTRNELEYCGKHILEMFCKID